MRVCRGGTGGSRGGNVMVASLVLAALLAALAVAALTLNSSTAREIQSARHEAGALFLAEAAITEAITDIERARIMSFGSFVTSEVRNGNVDIDALVASAPDALKTLAESHGVEVRDAIEQRVKELEAHEKKSDLKEFAMSLRNSVVEGNVDMDALETSAPTLLQSIADEHGMGLVELIENRIESVEAALALIAQRPTRPRGMWLLDIDADALSSAQALLGPSLSGAGLAVDYRLGDALAVAPAAVAATPSTSSRMVAATPP